MVGQGGVPQAGGMITQTIPTQTPSPRDDGELPVADPILSATGVRKTYRTGTHEVEALTGVDLDIWATEMVMVMGPSGNGKTTLLNCLSGLDEIDAGRVVVDDLDIHALSDAKRTEHRAQRMGFVFQSFNLVPVFSAVENVELPSARRPGPGARRPGAGSAHAGAGRTGGPGRSPAHRALRR